MCRSASPIFTHVIYFMLCDSSSSDIRLRPAMHALHLTDSSFTLLLVLLHLHESVCLHVYRSYLFVGFCDIVSQVLTSGNRKKLDVPGCNYVLDIDVNCKSETGNYCNVALGRTLSCEPLLHLLFSSCLFLPRLHYHLVSLNILILHFNQVPLPTSVVVTLVIEVLESLLVSPLLYHKHRLHIFSAVKKYLPPADICFLQICHVHFADHHKINQSKWKMHFLNYCPNLPATMWKSNLICAK